MLKDSEIEKRGNDNQGQSYERQQQGMQPPASTVGFRLLWIGYLLVQLPYKGLFRVAFKCPVKRLIHLVFADSPWRIHWSEHQIGFDRRLAVRSKGQLQYGWRVRFLANSYDALGTLARDEIRIHNLRVGNRERLSSAMRELAIDRAAQLLVSE